VQIAFSLLCLVGLAIFAWLLRRAYRQRRIAYDNLFGRTLYADLDTNPMLFWISFALGTFMCLGFAILAFEGPAPIGL